MTDYGNRPISINIRGLKELREFLKTAPRGITKEAIRAFSEYILGNESHGLRHEPPRREHGKGNPYQWQTEKQRRAFFATNGFGGGIPSNRTHRTVGGWALVPKSDGYQMQIQNNAPWADFVQGVVQQRGHWADGWRKARDIVESNTQGALRQAQAAVDRWIKEHGK